MSALDPPVDILQYLNDATRWPHIDLELTRKEYRQSESRLFIPEVDLDKDCCIELTRIGTSQDDNLTIETPERVVEVFDSQERSLYNTHLYYIAQSNSWSPLLLSVRLFTTLIEFLRAPPTFLQVIYLFSEKFETTEESFTAYYDSLNPASIAGKKDDRPIGAFSVPPMELTYTVKYPAPHGRAEQSNPYCIREIGVYQKLSSGKSDFLFIQMPETIKSRVERFLHNIRTVDHRHLRVHAIILLASSEHWRAYITHLEKSFSRQTTKMVFTKPERAFGNTADELNELTEGEKGIRQLQMLANNFQQVNHLLKLSITTATNIQALARRLCGNGAQEALSDVEADLTMFLVQQNIAKSRVELMLTCNAQSLQVQSASSNMQINLGMTRLTEQTHNLTEQSLKETHLMKKLTQYTTNDTRSMMLIALMTTIFLPATFVATLFGSNFFDFEAGEKNKSMKAASNVWIYVVVTIVLLVLTVVAGFVLWRKTRVNKADIEKAD